MDVEGDLLSEGIKLSDLLEKGVTINLDPNERKINYDCYENEFFDKPSQKDNYERGAPGELSFAEISKKMTKVDKEGKLKKVVVKEGYGAKVSSGAYVQIHYNGFWDGENMSFDSTLLREEPKSFIIGEGDVLSGIEEAVKTMTQGEEAEFLVSYKLLFGEAGCPPRIKPKADALFFIQVIRVIEGYKDSVMYKSQQQTEKKFEEVYKLAKSLHQNGLEAFKASNLDSAVRYFHKAATMLEFSKQTCPEEEEMQKSLLIKLYTNLAVCYNRKNCPKKACTMCNEVRRITNINTQVKTLYQHGIALQNLGEYERAKTMLMKAKKLKPTDEDINKRLVTILAIVDQGNKQEKDMCARIFQLESKEPSVKENDETNQIYGDNKIVDILEQFKTSTNKELTFSSFLAQKDVDLIKTLLASSMYNNMVLQKSSDKYVLKKK